MAKGPSTVVARVVLEGPRVGDKSVPAVYVRKWWWFFTTAWWHPAWIRHSYIANREAKAKNKAMDLYQQLLKAYEEAVAAEKDVNKFINIAREGSERGVSGPTQMKLGDREEYLLFDKDVWDKLKHILEALKSGRVDMSRRKHSGDRTAYYLAGHLGAFNNEAKGKPSLMQGIDHNMPFRPPEEAKKGGDKNKGQNQNNQSKDGVQVVMLQPSDKASE